MSTSDLFPRRGEIYWVNMDPALGTEIQKTRPAVILSCNIGNQKGSRVIVAPLTSTVKEVYRFEVLTELGTTKSKILLDQMRAVDKRRLLKKIDDLDFDVMKSVEEVLKVILALT